MNMDNSTLLNEIAEILRNQAELNRQILGVLQDMNERILAIGEEVKPTNITVFEASPGDLKAPDKVVASTSKVTTATKTVIKK